jgi:hypothetical protein
MESVVAFKATQTIVTRRKQDFITLIPSYIQNCQLNLSHKFSLDLQVKFSKTIPQIVHYSPYLLMFHGHVEH